MNKSLKIFSILFLVFIISCEEKKDQARDLVEEEEVSTIGNRIDSILIFQKRVLEDGDIYSYRELQTISLEVPPDDFLFWSLMMSNKYEYPPAYVDVFNTLLEANGVDIESIDSLDEKTKRMALEYLSVGAEKGNLDAIDIQEELGVN